MAAPYQTTNIDQLHNGLIPSAGASLYENTSATAKVQIVDIIIHNPHSVAVTVELWLVPDAGSASNTNKFLKKSIVVDGTLAFKIPIVMKPGAAIHGQASVNNVTNIFLNGIEFDKSV